MARTTRSRRKMANTTDAPSPASSLLSSTTTAPFISPTSTTYSTEGYTFNYTGLSSLGGYSLEDLNYTELWVDVWNSTEASNVTERLNTTVLSSGGGYCDEWEAAQHKLFQVYTSSLSINSIFGIRSLGLSGCKESNCVDHWFLTTVFREIMKVEFLSFFFIIFMALEFCNIFQNIKFEYI